MNSDFAHLLSPGNIGTMNLTDATATSTLDLQANAITTLTVAGNLLNSAITLSQPVSLLKQALSNLAVTGDITGSQIRTVNAR